MGKQRGPKDFSALRGQSVVRNRPVQMLLEQKKRLNDNIEADGSDKTASVENNTTKSLLSTRYPIMAAATVVQMRGADRLFLENRPNSRVSGVNIEHFKYLYQPEVIFYSLVKYIVYLLVTL
jgi:hypothetical protein